MPQTLKVLSLAITLLGIIILLLALNLSSPIKVTSPEQLSSLVDNTKVQTQGLVIKESALSYSKLLKLDNNIEILSDLSSPKMLNTSIIVLGVTSTYLNKTQIQALKITIRT